MSALNRVIVPMPSFTNPNNPVTAAGSVNLELDEHPVTHAEDYGAAVQPGEHSVTSPMDVHAKEMADAANLGGEPGRREAAKRTKNTVEVEFPENREEWQKKHWQAKARDLGLSTSGNTDAVQARVEEQEAIEEEYKAYGAQDWKDDIEKAETTDDLAEIRAAYDRSGADFSTVASAFEARETELNDDEQ